MNHVRIAYRSRVLRQLQNDPYNTIWPDFAPVLPVEEGHTFQLPVLASTTGATEPWKVVNIVHGREQCVDTAPGADREGAGREGAGRG